MRHASHSISLRRAFLPVAPITRFFIDWNLMYLPTIPIAVLFICMGRERTVPSSG